MLCFYCRQLYLETVAIYSQESELVPDFEELKRDTLRFHTSCIKLYECWLSSQFHTKERSASLGQSEEIVLSQVSVWDLGDNLNRSLMYTQLGTVHVHVSSCAGAWNCTSINHPSIHSAIPSLRHPFLFTCTYVHVHLSIHPSICPCRHSCMHSCVHTHTLHTCIFVVFFRV